MARLSNRAKLRKGTLRPSRLNRPAQQTPVSASDLTPRADLPADVQAAFARVLALVAPLGTLTAADVLALEQCARALADVERYAHVLATHGAVYEGRTRWGMTLRPRPEVNCLANAERALLSALKELGLTPATRNRVDTVGPLPTTDPLEVLLRRRERAREAGAP
jgi:P27 family predicted phage terminase small subunit